MVCFVFSSYFLIFLSFREGKELTISSKKIQESYAVVIGNPTQNCKNTFLFLNKYF